LCGIFAYIDSGKIDEERQGVLASQSNSISYRGPDSTSNKMITENIMMGFHRLSIMDVSNLGSQPMAHPSDKSVTMVCNGEIYNYKELKDEYGLTTKSNSDCEVILHLYKIMPMKDLLRKLDGVFAFVIHDSSSGITYAARDSIGVRPMFYGANKDSEGASYVFSSELKGCFNLCDNSKQFPPGCYWSSEYPDKTSRFYSYSYRVSKKSDELEFRDNIRDLLTKSVRKRLMSDREVGCLLSGGLDSSLIASLVQRDMREFATSSHNDLVATPNSIKTFSIGMPGSPDLMYAKQVARWIKSDHHEVLVSPKDFLDAIPEVIRRIESFDTTTVRASVGNYLVSKYISENTDCKVIFNGDGADEVCVGYVYNKNAPTLSDLQKESVRLVKELCYFDVLRSDRSISSNGLEPRTPFLDTDFVDYYMKIPPKFKAFDKRGAIEKRLLRKSFESEGLLPDKILWRDKCAFSDGVSSARNSWHKVVQDHVDKIISDEDFEREAAKVNYCKPLLKESLYYRNIYRGIFGDKNFKVIPHFWMPRWTDVIDPSARELSGYKE
tara:strand:+ start:12778 stop:14433 length:1656 start_codon:yes stop_codon:yes gene_type:complete